MVNRKTANNQVKREKENSKELSFLSRIIYAVLSRETYPDSRKDTANIQIIYYKPNI